MYCVKRYEDSLCAKVSRRIYSKGFYYMCYPISHIIKLELREDYMHTISHNAIFLNSVVCNRDVIETESYCFR